MFFYHFGKYLLFLKNVFTKPENFKVYWKEIVREMNLIGVGSLGIIAVISIFLGAVTCIQTAYQLVSNLIPRDIIGVITRDSVILEFSPTISLLVLSGRVGGSISSQLGTMRVTEQIDALEIMGINSTGFLVLPKIVAAVITIPMLVIISMFLGLMGAYIIGPLTGVISGTEFISGVLRDWNSFIIFVALIKTVLFSFLMTSVSAYQGFYTKGGALEVGESSTKAVVYSSVLILFADYLVAQILL
jgi:phospholipid/cholesterol/gamma-HCH transport system permease protein